MKIMKSYKMEESVIEMINKTAEREFDGNMTAALESLINQAYRMREIEEKYRFVMYRAYKNEGDLHDHVNARNIIDGLHI